MQSTACNLNLHVLFVYCVNTKLITLSGTYHILPGMVHTCLPVPQVRIFYTCKKCMNSPPVWATRIPCLQSILYKIEKRQLWVRPIEWLKLSFASCVVHQTRSFIYIYIHFFVLVSFLCVPGSCVAVVSCMALNLWYYEYFTILPTKVMVRTQILHNTYIRHSGRG